jgi:hypothetical protein
MEPKREATSGNWPIWCYHKDSVLQQGYPKLEQTHFVPIFVSGRVVVFFLLFFSFLFSSPGAMAVLIRRILFLRFVDGSLGQHGSYASGFPASKHRSFSQFVFLFELR